MASPLPPPPSLWHYQEKIFFLFLRLPYSMRWDWLQLILYSIRKCSVVKLYYYKEKHYLWENVNHNNSMSYFRWWYAFRKKYDLKITAKKKWNCLKLYIIKARFTYIIYYVHSIVVCLKLLNRNTITYKLLCNINPHQLYEESQRTILFCNILPSLDES